MPQPIPYLSFNGDCADAMRFYAKVLGGKLDLLTFGKTPMSAQMPKDMHDKIANSRLSVDGNILLYGSDTPPHVPYQGIHGMSVSLAFDTVEQAERTFGALSEGGKVGMPLGPTFWAKRFGMLTDKFGCPWLINGELIEVPM